ncbi:hypothetical protein GL305_18240 [Nocardia seriolae]|nr:hypothetical protein [Nocardia seriolae]MTK31848.1 hypothetical protein [Nocardia seriolae]MTL13424.1 hypothetical protein [Nocardia seriolae]OJF80083.1 hypothetical protein NS14008_13875 [Nocardia seriolae]PSK33214.1 hypothetical protein C6575_01485 [Nocardia seriolae]RLP32018.1 hypothetical protein D6158_09910 [Nocardia seriolae]
MPESMVRRAGGEPDPSRAETGDIAAYLDMLTGYEHTRCPCEETGDDDLDMATSLQDRVFGARGVSRRLSVDLETLGPHTRVQGSGVMAVPGHLRHYPRRGALPI